MEGNRNFFAGEILVHNCLMVDDPHDAEEVNSDASRNGVRDRWNGAIANRVNDLRSSVRIGIMQRVHSEDWSGLVLESGGWEHLCLPMEFEPDRACTTAIGWSDPRTQPGELLFPERFPPRVLEQERARLGSYGYAGQHQQRPAPRDGGMFKRAWFSVVDAVPVGVDRVRAYDLAATPDGDYTVGSKLARTHDGMFYVEDVVRGRWTPHERDAVILQTAQADGKSVPIWVEQEPGSAGVSVIASLVRMLAGFTIHGERATGDKVTRASSFAAQCEAGNVKLLKGEWNRDWLDELTIFPNGKFDDQVDATSLAFNQLADGHHRWGFHLSPKK